MNKCQYQIIAHDDSELPKCPGCNHNMVLRSFKTKKPVLLFRWYCEGCNIIGIYGNQDKL